MQSGFLSGVSVAGSTTASAETTGTTESVSSAATTESLASSTVGETTQTVETTSEGK